MTEPLVRPRNTSVHVARPMFELKPDDSESCLCHVYDDEVCSAIAMRVTAADYRKPDRWFL